MVVDQVIMINIASFRMPCTLIMIDTSVTGNSRKSGGLKKQLQSTGRTSVYANYLHRSSGLLSVSWECSCQVPGQV